MAAIFMKDKSNVFASETIPKTFYCPSLPRQLGAEFSMAHETKPIPKPLGGVPLKQRTKTNEIKQPRTDAESIGGSVDSVDSTVAKYIERFRQAKPCSRESRSKDDHTFWWKNLSTPPQPTAKESPDLQPPNPYLSPSTLSSHSDTDKDLDRCDELLNKSEAVLRSSSCPAQVCSASQHQPPLAPHEDILYQWRLRRKLELAQELVTNPHHPHPHHPHPHHPHPHLHQHLHHLDLHNNGGVVDGKNKMQSWCHGDKDLASAHTSTCFSPPTSCCTGIHLGSAIPRTHDNVGVDDLITQGVGSTTEYKPAILGNERRHLSQGAVISQGAVTLHTLGTQTEDDSACAPSHMCSSQVEGSPCNPAPIPYIQPKPSVLYPDSSLLTMAESSLDSSGLEQSFSMACGTTDVHTQERVSHTLLQTTPHLVASPAGAVHISSSSEHSASCIGDELLHLLFVRARLLETQLREIDSCLTAVEECSR